MPFCFRVYEPGGPDALKLEEVDAPSPGPGEVLIKHTAVGVNFIDIYYRRGSYRLPEYPFTPGFEGCGVVVRVGEGCEYLKIGDRVAYALGPLGAYCEMRTIPEKALVRIPNAVSNEQAAAILMRGLTAHFLTRRTYIVHRESTVLVHAAAGGVGTLVAQWAHYLGARVIGTVGSDEKRELAESCGCDLVINYTKEDFVEAVQHYTRGKGVNVVYDSVGQDTLMKSMDCAARFGTIVSYGQSSGPVPPIDLSLLREKGSLFITRPTLFDYCRDIQEYNFAATEVFDMILKRHLRVNVMQTYRFEDAAYAHEQIETRQTKGPSVLVLGKKR